MIDPKTKLIVIVGPTASGKTALALELAEEFGGEIVCADSRTIYAGMDIGTAKPDAAERARVPHHLLDVVRPDETYTAAEFKVAAERVIGEIAGRGRVPLLVGGTGLYAYAVAYDFAFPAGPRTALRAELEGVPLAELVARLEREDPERAAEIDLQNPRRVIRALETVGQPRQRAMVLPDNVLLVGLRPSMEALSNKIVQRTEAMFELGLVGEVRGLVAKYGPDLEVLKSPGYAEVMQYLRGDVTLEEAKGLVSLHTRQLVKRQLTWFRRNDEIRWLEGGDGSFAEQAAVALGEARELVQGFLTAS